MIPFAFFLSGAAGLIYETLWIRWITQYCGHTVLAVSAVLTAFMAGLAAGSVVGGRAADRRSSAALVKLYAVLELAVAALGLGAKPAIEAAGTLLLHAGVLNAPPFAQSLVYFLAAVAVLFLPAMCMGATLPILVRAWSSETGSGDRPLALLYGINTAGAVAGTATAGFFLLPFFGGRITLLCAAGLNLLCAALAFYSIRGEKFSPVSATVRPNLNPLPASILLLTGASAMICQVAWTRAFTPLLGSTTYAFSVMLSTFLTGLAGGALLFDTFRRRLRPTYSRLAAPLTAAGAMILAGLYIFDKFPFILLTLYPVAYVQPDLIFFVQFALCAAIMLLPTLLMGAALPWTIAAAQPATRSIGSETGGYYAANTAGAIIGSAAAGLFLIPYAGVETTLSIGAAGFLTAAFVSAFKKRDTRRRIAAAALLFAVFAFVRPPWNREALASGVFLYARFYHETGKASRADFYKTLNKDRVIFHKAGSNATVSVLESRFGARYLRINGKTDASESGDMSTQLLVGHLPLLLHAGRPQTALAVGLGSGMTAAALASHKSIRTVDVLEIEPAVAQAARYFKRSNRDVLNDSKIHLRYADARQFLAAPGPAYDILTSEPSNPWISGIAGLFTREAFLEAKKRLAPDGIYCQWFHSYSMSDDDFKMVMRTFADVFPHVMLFSNAEADFFLLGSKRPWQTNLARARAIHEDNEYLLRFFSRLRRGLDDPFTLLARTFVLGDEDFRRFAAAGELHTDDKLQLEFSGPRNLLTRRSSEILDDLTAEKRTLLPDGIAPLLGRDARWAQLYAMAAIGHLRALEPEKAADMIKRALDIDRANPQAWTGLGLVNEASAKDKEAIGAYKKAIAYRPGYAWAHARLGALLIATGDDKEGVRHLKRALVLEPGDPFANFRLAEFYAKRGETRSAEPLLDAALSLPIPDDDLWEAVSDLQKSLD